MIQHSGKKYHEPVSDLIRADDPTEAEEIQEMLRISCIVDRTIDIDDIRYVAGADAAYTVGTIYAAVVVMTFPGLDVVEKTSVVQDIPFPYITGLLSFREGPAITEAFSSLVTVPDVLFINGHGYAHPKRIGIASHVGIVLDIPSVGVARRLMIGDAAMPGKDRGSTEPVLDKNDIIGMAVRTVGNGKPVFVSAGHKVDLAQAVDLVLNTTITHRLSEPLWHADRLSRQCRSERSRC